MEEILASIRRIIADDASGLAQRVHQGLSVPTDPHQDPTDVAADPDMDALFDSHGLSQRELSEDDMFGPADEPVAREIEPAPTPVRPRLVEVGAADLVFPEPPQHAAPSPAPYDAPAPAPEPEPASFRSKADDQPVAAEPEPEPRAIPHPVAGEERLLSPNTGEAVSGAFATLANLIMPHQPRTLEDLIGDIVRPMLKSWLDENLPPLVERLIREEIERISQRARR